MVDFYEIQINGGAYISTESNRDIVSTVIEEKGKVPSNVFEEDYRTVYSRQKTMDHLLIVFPIWMQRERSV